MQHYAMVSTTTLARIAHSKSSLLVQGLDSLTTWHRRPPPQVIELFRLESTSILPESLPSPQAGGWPLQGPSKIRSQDRGKRQFGRN